MKNCAKLLTIKWPGKEPDIRCKPRRWSMKCVFVLSEALEIPWQDRAHFMALSAQLMRRVLVDHARGRGRAKRGGAIKKLSLDESLAIPVGPDADIVRLDDALNSLAAADARKAKTVELRFFGGFSVEETAKSAECLRPHGDERLEICQSLAAARNAAQLRRI